MKKSLLEVNKLEINYYKDNETLYVLNDVSFKLYEDEVVVLVSEQNIFREGLIYSLMGIIDKPLGKVTRGEIYFKGKSILDIKERELRQIRGNKISAIPDTGISGLNPRLKIGYQIKESLVIHKKLKREDRDKRVKKLLERLGVEDVGEVCESYPYQLDEKTIYIVHLAIGLICKPEILIINNTSKSLDKKERIDIYNLLKEIKRELSLSILFMTNVLEAVDEIADRVIIANKGILLEDSPIKIFSKEPLHPYSKGLVNNDIEEEKEWDLKSKSYSCIFYDKCNERREVCFKYLPEYFTLKEGEKVRCILYK